MKTKYLVFFLMREVKKTIVLIDWHEIKTTQTMSDNEHIYPKYYGILKGM